MTRISLIFVLLLSLTACDSGGLSERDITATAINNVNTTVVAQIAETNTASANFGLTQSAATLVSTSTPTTPTTRVPSIEPPTITPTVFVTEDTRIAVTLNPSVITDLEAPMRIQVPDGWEYVSDALMIPGAEGMSVVPFSLYRGEVTGGQGTIILMWAFENVVPASPTGQSLSSFNLYADGLRLLLFTIIESECQFGYDEEQSFPIAGFDGRGTEFVADDCPDGLPSMQGWFSAFRANRLNFSFYAYTEPKEAILGSAREELQAILDSVVFDFSLLPTAAPTEFPATIITLTPSATSDVPTVTPEPTTPAPTSTQPPPPATPIPPTPVPPTATTSVIFATATP